MASELVTTACSSFRAVGKSLKIINKYLPIETPSTASIRQWVYRLGYYELIEQLNLKRAHFKRANWVLIADFTAQIGTYKCFIVLGIRLDKLKSCQWHLSHQDVTLLGLELWEHPNGEKVFQCLEKISTQVGVPVQIVVDGASDLNKGVNLFCERHPKTQVFYDISHKLACLLEKYLKDDEDWNLFVNSVSTAKAQSQQTMLTCLTPPQLRTKARYMNLHTMVRWAVRILKFREKNNFEGLGLGFGFDEPGFKNLVLNLETRFQEQEFNLEEAQINKLLECLPNLLTENHRYDRERFYEKLVSILEPIGIDGLEEIILDAANFGQTKFEEIFGWTCEQSSAIHLYSILLQMVEFVEEKIKNHGLNRRTVASCRKQIKELSNCELSHAFGCEVIEFLEQQIQKVPLGKTYLASSDIVESLIGKFKFLNQRVASIYGLNQSVLLFGTLTAEITPKKIKNAMETVSWNKIKQWTHEQIPVSNVAKRYQALFKEE
jgi:hypothetical protein